MEEQDNKLLVEASVHHEPANSSEDSTMQPHSSEAEKLGTIIETIIFVCTKINVF